MANPRPSSLILPMRADPRWGLHVLKDVNPAYPVGQSEQSEIDPTADYFYGTPGGIYIPTLEPQRTISSSLSVTLCDTFGCDITNQYQIVMSGVTGTCCGNFNRTWTLVRFTGTGSVNCDWREFYDPGDCTRSGSTFKRWLCRMSIGSSVVNLFFADSTLATDTVGTTRAQYSVSKSSFSCTGSSTFSLSSSNTCTGWPSTITVTKV